MFQFFPITDDFLPCLGVKVADIHMGIVHGIEAFLVERYQVVDTVYLIKWKVRVNTMRPRRARDKPDAADPSFEFVAV